MSQLREKKMVPWLQDEHCLILYLSVVVLISNLCSGVVEMVLCVGIGGGAGSGGGTLGIWMGSLPKMVFCV